MLACLAPFVGRKVTQECKPRVVVGLDFGTTFSGFAFAHIGDPEKVYTFYDYPKAGLEKPYCKTLTGSYYKNVGGEWKLKSWGLAARAEYARDFQAMVKQRNLTPGAPGNAEVGTYVTKFKLHLASRDLQGATALPELPPGLTVNQLITDYLREMGALVLKTLQVHFKADLPMQAVQWCVTVPSIWDNAAKAVMKECMASAGLVSKRQSLIMVLEPEAASFHCHKLMSDERVLRVGDKLLVADIGGGTSDIVVQEVVSLGQFGYRVREVTTSSGDLCGGHQVDAQFVAYLHKKIGPCLNECISEQPSVYAQLIAHWQTLKASFGEESSLGNPMDMNLPNKLVTRWEEYERRMGLPERESYDELEISHQEMQSIFDPTVEQNLQLIERQLQEAGGVKVLVVVGGFASSPYLMDCIRKRFAGNVSQIISPANPGSAVCQGAVMLASHPDTVLSRICKKTYGISHYGDFDPNLDAPQYRAVIDGVLRCSKRFSVYVRKGDKVDVNACISKIFYPTYLGQKQLTFPFFSSELREPRYTVGEGVRKEGEIVIDISKDMTLETFRQVKVSLFFGGSSMEIKAEALNFSAGGPRQLELPVEVGFC